MNGKLVNIHYIYNYCVDIFGAATGVNIYMNYVIISQNLAQSVIFSNYGWRNFDCYTSMYKFHRLLFVQWCRMRNAGNESRRSVNDVSIDAFNWDVSIQVSKLSGHSTNECLHYVLSSTKGYLYYVLILLSLGLK